MGTVAVGIGRIAAVMTTASFVVLPVSGPAAAGTVQTQNAWSTNKDQDVETAQVGCRAGRRPIGVGADVEGAMRHAGLVRVPFLPDGSGVYAIAEEGDDDYDKGWAVRAYAFCHVTPAQWQVVSRTTVAGSAKTQSATATCPPGTKALGVGGGVLNGDGQVVLDDLRINADLTGVQVTGVEDGNGYAGQWRMQAQAVCAAPQPGQQRHHVSSPTNSHGHKVIVVTCPVGQQAHGVGAELNGAQGQARIRTIRPKNYSGGRSIEIIAEDDLDGYTGSWSITGYAVCAS